MEEELRNAEEADRRKKEEEERQRQLAANPPAQLEAGATPAAESIYPYGGTNGEVVEAQAQAEATYPSIQPPSTGEPIPAAWPANETSEVGSSHEDYTAPVVPAEESAAEKENLVIDTAVEDTNKATEPAAHNG